MDDKLIGQNYTTPDLIAKVTGKALYIADLHVAGAWFGGVVRSNVARGVLRGFDFAPGFDRARVVARERTHALPTGCGARLAQGDEERARSRRRVGAIE